MEVKIAFKKVLLGYTWCCYLEWCFYLEWCLCYHSGAVYIRVVPLSEWVPYNND